MHPAPMRIFYTLKKCFFVSQVPKQPFFMPRLWKQLKKWTPFNQQHSNKEQPYKSKTGNHSRGRKKAKKKTCHRGPLQDIAVNEATQNNSNPSHTPLTHLPAIFLLRSLQSTQFKVITISGEADSVEVRTGTRLSLKCTVPPDGGTTETHSFPSPNDAADFATQLLLSSLREGFTEGECPRCGGPGPEKESEWEGNDHRALMCGQCGLEWIGGGG